MLCDWLDWHRATLLRKCAGLNAVQLATRAVPSSRLSLLGPARAQEDYDIYLAECRAIDAALKGATLDDTYTFRGQACEPSPGRQLPTEPPNQECPFAATVFAGEVAVLARWATRSKKPDSLIGTGLCPGWS